MVNGTCEFIKSCSKACSRFSKIYYQKENFIIQKKLLRRKFSKAKYFSDFPVFAHGFYFW